MSVFDRYERMASRSIDRLNSDPLILIPMIKSTNGRGRPDPARDQTVCDGVFEYISEERGLQLGVRKSYREANDLRALQIGREPVISVDRRHFPQGQTPRQGDIARLPTRDELPDFDIVSVQPDGHSRIVLKLTPRGEVTP